MRLDGKHCAILVEKDYQDLEVWYPLLRLKEEGAIVFTVGTGSSEEYKGKYGYPLKVDRIASDVSPDDLDAIIIPGGWAPDFLRRYPEVVNLVRACYDQGRIIASICHGGSLLVSAGIASGLTLTAFRAIRDDLVAAGANFVDREVVQDGTLITSRTPEDLPAFLRTIIAALEQG
jgi:protease I